MKKIFLYLYPIKEFTNMFLLSDDKLYDEWGVERPLPILNETINKRYREQGYKIVYVLYPDKEMFGIEKQNGDKVIYTDITFDEASAYDSNGNEKQNFIPKYPNEEKILEQLGYVDELVVGGYHAMDCVKRVAEVALQNGINTLVDLELTDLFFNVYKQKDCFDMENYSPEMFKKNMIATHGNYWPEYMEELFDKNYESPVYGFNIVPSKKKK